MADVYTSYCPQSSLMKKALAYQKNIDDEIREKVFLIDSDFAGRPADRIAKYSLRDLEDALDENKKSADIKEMFVKHEALIQILIPYKDKTFDGLNFIYSDLHEQKYRELKKRFLTCRR